MQLGFEQAQRWAYAILAGGALEVRHGRATLVHAGEVRSADAEGLTEADIRIWARSYLERCSTVLTEAQWSACQAKFAVGRIREIGLITLCGIARPLLAHPEVLEAGAHELMTSSQITLPAARLLYGLRSALIEEARQCLS